MSTFRTKKEAEAYAGRRRKGFRKLLGEARAPRRKLMLRKAIKSVKIRKIKYSHWKRPLYEVKG